MFIDIAFEPFFLFPNPHEQTILGCLVSLPKQLRSETKYVLLPDGDKLAYEVTTPRGWKPEDPTVLMIHGLGGHHKSAPVVRLANKLKRRKIRCIRLNLRGCGSGKGLARKLYHAGQSDDLLHALKVIKQETPNSPITVIGYSLGGNIVLKLAGELKEEALKYMEEVIAVSPPIDLQSTTELLKNPLNNAYQKYFMRLIKEDMEERKRFFPDEKYINIYSGMSFLEYDELYTAPAFGFSSAYEYYEKCSSKNYISNITVPCNIILSRDDPLISTKSFDEISLPSNVWVYTTNFGGHVGYVAAPGSSRGYFWLDTLLLEWISEKK